MDICSLDQVLKKSVELCKIKEMDKINAPFCSMMNEYDFYKNRYELGRLVKELPPFWEVQASEDFRTSEMDAKVEVIKAVCRPDGTAFAENLKTFTGMKCNLVPMSCDRFKKEFIQAHGKLPARLTNI